MKINIFYLETSNLIEAVLEAEVETLTKKCKSLEKENTKLKDESLELKVFLKIEKNREKKTHFTEKK